jgi:hypothetical protein
MEDDFSTPEYFKQWFQVKNPNNYTWFKGLNQPIPGDIAQILVLDISWQKDSNTTRCQGVSTGL